MAVMEESTPNNARKVIVLPAWWKTAVAFIVGAVVASVSLVQVVPGSLSGDRRTALGGRALSSGESEIFVDEEGVEYEIDDLGNLTVRTVEGEEGAEGSTVAGSEGRQGGTSGSSGSVGGGSSGGSGVGSGGTLACKAGQNGGATDIGVTADKIRLATTAVLDGPAASLLRDSVTGIKAVLDKAGLICGRRLELKPPDNDSFDASRGQQYIRNYIDSKQYFALPVVPSAEGLSAALSYINEAGMPVVGSDGLRIDQYSQTWVWPVAAATVSTMRIMAKVGKEQKGAQSFAIVWDSKYKFGVEGRNAFVSQVQALGGVIKADRQLDPDQPSYASEADAFNTICGGGQCDMVALLLLPDTAKKWMARNPAMGKLYTAGAQTLFTDRFGQDCVQAASERCHGLTVWTGYNPPIGPLASKPGVAGYVNDVRALNPSIDVRNQFLQGAYLGMSVFVEALKRVGPGLTRAALRAELDKMDYQTDLSSTLSWRPGNHWANASAQSFSMVVTQGTFNGWSHQTGFVRDPAR